MIGKWIDLVILVFLALGLLKGFKRGLVRELFSLMGAVLAIIIAYHSYQNIAVILLEKYQLSTWQAQIISFMALLLGISLLGVFFGYVWSKVLSYTPFSILDHIGGAAFGVAKIGAVILILLIFLGTINNSFISAILDESVVVQQIGVLLPFVYDYIDHYWPEQLQRPQWLFPPQNPERASGVFLETSPRLA